MKTSLSIIGLFLLAACDHTSDKQIQDAVTKTTQRAENVEAAATYKNDLRDCREKGKDAGSYDVYEACAKQADERYYGKDGGK